MKVTNESVGGFVFLPFAGIPVEAARSSGGSGRSFRTDCACRGFAALYTPGAPVGQQGALRGAERGGGDFHWGKRAARSHRGPSIQFYFQ